PRVLGLLGNDGGGREGDVRSDGMAEKWGKWSAGEWQEIWRMNRGFESWGRQGSSLCNFTILVPVVREGLPLLVLVVSMFLK
nr:hypothetical protein [Tanacetum cinerariifolium]